MATSSVEPGAPPPTLPRKRKRGPKLNEKERQTRAEMVLARKITGQSVQAVMEEFNISRATAYRALSQARREGMYEQAKDWVLTRLLPKALAVYDTALDNMDVEVARDVLQGLGITGRHVTIVTPQVNPVEDFDAWRLKKVNASAVDAEVTEPSKHESTAYQTGASESSDGLPPGRGLGDGPQVEPSRAADREPGIGEPGLLGGRLRSEHDPKGQL